ncbi:YbaK/EbsC family protein [Geobacter sp. SVR]|uniref:YbaK/EbsC family protein n=1 Tax=Geobacter sp. SVR TaxID=2495594 RepID=UPI00143EFA09|nr:YbaK/EbsC family protein [Geobacter sp. SVR]BCS52833.1 aminoacyl-tRNA deacylase [Geobacter sp. SVR]GCF86700.1 prolyl-tRNA editing protein [Geobacter sp. SVR]
MSKKSSASVQRVREALTAAGLDNEVQELAASTRSAVEAADAVGCDVAQIVKSLVLKGATSGELFLVLTSGGNRVCLERIKNLAGEEVAMADAGSVRERTGFAIGGVPPLGHLAPLQALIDQDLMAHAVIWAAAGSPNALFHLTPEDLVRITGGTVAVVAEGK